MEWISNRIPGGRRDAQDLRPGEAAVLRGQIAAYRHEDGTIEAVSAVCTHMGCIVQWNAVDRTWDCPCHGSRFTTAGEVLHGPAIRPLEAKRLS
jgi:Rieske Fe-S protein